MATNLDILHSYRHLSRHCLRAVQYSSPARFTLRDHLRSAYRKGSTADFDQQRINNTLEFLQGAAKEKGLEHKVIKNLAKVWWWRSFNAKRVRPKAVKEPDVERQMKATAFVHFDATVRMLNESMGMCLR